MSYSVGIVGTGAIAAVHAAAARESGKTFLKAVYNHNEAKGRAFASSWGVDYCATLDELCSSVDIVCVTTPSGAHLDPVMCAIAHGVKAVFVEKPIEITPVRCDQMIKAARDAGVVIAGVFQSRFYPAAKLVKQAIDEGRFGRVTLLEAQFKWYRSQEYYSDSPWHGTKALDGGGVLMNQGIHAIDLLRWFGGPVESLSSFCSALGHEGIEVEDTAVASLRFESGALGVIQGTTASWPGFKKRIEVCGTRGSAILEEDALLAWEFQDARPEDEEVRKRFQPSSGQGGAADPMAISSFGHIAAMKDLADALDEGREPFINGEEAAKAVELVDSIYKAAR